MAGLTDKVALITGASKGIGRGIAEAFARAGARLMLTARSEERLAALVQELNATGTESFHAAADVADETQVQNVFRQVQEKFGRLDILVNNAGVFDGGPLDQFSLATWEKVMAVNLRGPFLCTREAMRIMKQQGSGRIINVGSISALRVRPHSAAYSTSKHGLWGMTQVTALEGRPYGITCGCLHPGNVEVETLAGASHRSQEPTMNVADIAEAALTMAALPAHVNMLEAVVLPVNQPFLGRG